MCRNNRPQEEKREVNLLGIKIKCKGKELFWTIWMTAAMGGVYWLIFQGFTMGEINNVLAIILAGFFSLITFLGFIGKI